MCKIGLDGRARCESLLCGEALGGRQSGQGEADEATMNVTVLIDAIVRQTTVLRAGGRLLRRDALVPRPRTLEEAPN